MQQNPIPDPAGRMDSLEREVLYRLCGFAGNNVIWTEGDLAHEMDDADSVEVALHALSYSGLVHKTGDGVVFASRAGYRVAQLVDFAE